MLTWQEERADLLAHDLLFLSRGQPVVYYGDEQGFTGADPGGDKSARQTLFAASQDLPGNTFVGPRFGFRGATGPTQLIKPAARSSTTAIALWGLSSQLTDTEFPL